MTQTADPPPPSVAFQGERGAFSEEAVHRLFGQMAELVPCRTFGDVADAVLRDRATFGVLPVENTIVGPITAALDVLTEREPEGLVVVCEVRLPIRLCLLTLPGGDLQSVHTVTSHPVALRQCAASLRALLPYATLRESYDTAGAVREVASAGDWGVAAVASRHAGDLYGLAQLVDGLEDVAGNATRFLAMAKKTGASGPPPGPAPNSRAKLLVR
ncbi:MAG: hypothetical protein NVS4B3_09160 [Gemmatimonadaceae bacterium]